MNGMVFSFPVISAHPIERFAEGHEGVLGLSGIFFSYGSNCLGS